jgi:hypothetical protein
VRARAAEIFPFAIAVLLPPAGLVLALVAIEEDRDLAIRLGAVAVLAAAVWAFLLFGG